MCHPNGVVFGNTWTTKSINFPLPLPLSHSPFFFINDKTDVYSLCSIQSLMLQALTQSRTNYFELDAL